VKKLATGVLALRSLTMVTWQRIWPGNRRIRVVPRGLPLSLVVVLVVILSFELWALVYYGTGSANVVPTNTSDCKGC